MKCMILALLLLSGCNGVVKNNTVAVVGRVPVIPEVEKPKQELLTPGELMEYRKLPEELRIKLQNNDKALKIFGEQLDVSVKLYNNYARQHNDSSDAWLNATLGKKDK